MLNKTSRIIALIVLMLGFLAITNGLKAQNVVRNGNKFEVVSKDTMQTDLLFVDKNGKAYPIYLSSKGKAYIICKSKKTGKLYRRYLPKITQMLDKEENGRRIK